jgi:uncharacterized protein YqeY
MLLETIKSDLNESRRSGDSAKRDILTVLLSQVEARIKDTGQEVVDADVINLVKKCIKEREELAGAYVTAGRPTLNIDTEISILKAYIPQQISREDLKTIITTVKEVSANADGPKLKGVVMKYLKQNYDGTYDPSMASSIIDEINK